MQFRDIPSEVRSQYAMALTHLRIWDFEARTRLMLLRWRYERGELMGDSPAPPRLGFARYLYETGRIGEL